MFFFKKLSNWLEQLEKFDLQKKQMRRDDRLGEVACHNLQQKDKQECGIEACNKLCYQTVMTK